uniref:Putative ixodes 8-cys protein n=1 Tax=Ixodes ricinus TaxID=34613 RepID=A0A0K8RH79_IXORI
MFKLRFFILFLLAGSYFAESSSVESDSGAGEELAPLKVEGETSPSGTGASDSEKKDENTDGSQTNGEKEAEGGGSKEKEGAGYGLPEYIGSSEERRDYMIKLLSTCSNQNQMYSVNEKDIFFHNCTYICVKRDANLTPEVRRIPPGMICNKDQGKCPDDGNCPLPMC